MKPAPLHRATLAAHELPPRWRIEARESELPAASPNEGRLTLIRWAHADAGVPPLRSLVTLTWPHSQAEPVHADVIELPTQLTLDGDLREAA